MNILINGESQHTEVGATLATLIQTLDLTGKRLAVEVNEEVIPRSGYGAYRLSDGDRIEIVQAIGGG